MNVLRVAPYPIVVFWDVPSPSTAYYVKLTDSVDGSTETQEIVSGSDSRVEHSFALSELRTDREFDVTISEGILNGDLLVEDHLSIVRPYVDPTRLATGATDIAEYTNNEFIARSIIDAIVVDGFYNKKSILHGEGMGADIFPLWDRTNRVLKVSENNTSIYDSEAVENDQVFTLTDNSAGIQRFEEDTYNRNTSAPVTMFNASGNLAYIAYRGTAFPRGYDYTFTLDSGYKSVPSDIELATLLLIEDLKCGKLDYYKRLITEYDAIEFKVVFDKGALVETGNNIVDKILKKYRRDVMKPGIL